MLSRTLRMAPRALTAAARPAIARAAPRVAAPAAPVRLYHDKVIDHYERPRNTGSFNKSDGDVGTGLVGAPACGDVMKLQIRVDPESQTISDVRFKTFGCGSAIASSSYLTELVKGMTLDEAGRVKNTDIAKELCLPPVKRELIPVPPTVLSGWHLLTVLSSLLHARPGRDPVGHLQLLHQEPRLQGHGPRRHRQEDLGRRGGERVSASLCHFLKYPRRGVFFTSRHHHQKKVADGPVII